jgi:hypothetical protein
VSTTNDVPQQSTAADVDMRVQLNSEGYPAVAKHALDHQLAGLTGSR